MVKTQSTENDYHCILSNDKLTVSSDAPVFKGGLGNGFRPHELLEGALASCINISIRMFAKEKNIKLEKVETEVDIEKTPDKTIFKYKITLDDTLSAADKNYLMNIIDLCAVKQSLSKQLEFKQENPPILLNSIITCPACGFKKEEEMPVNACQFFYECANCKQLLKPKEGDCCVFCSYGSVKCPPVQETGKCDCCG